MIKKLKLIINNSKKFDDQEYFEIPNEVKIGISHSGEESIFIRDITYSGVNLS